MTERLEAALADAALGGSPETIALMRVLIEASDEAEARAALLRRIAIHDALADRPAIERLQRLRALWQAHPQAWAVVRTTIAGIAHDQTATTAEGSLRYWAEAFDRLAAASPEAGVALYSLGSPALLAEATDEIVALLQSWALIGPDHDVLDLGCGIGRFLVALAPLVRSVLGLDLASRMVAEARRRCAGLPNVTVAATSGRDLAAVADASLDLVLAVDVFPYLVQAGGGLAAVHLQAFERVLRPGGTVLVLNYSYRGDLEADRREMAVLSAAAALDLMRNGVSVLTRWDGVAFLLGKPRGATEPQ